MTMIGDESDHLEVLQGPREHMGALIGTADITHNQSRVHSIASTHR
jgi:hypothetical protein